jgi:PhoPQ-activated pathogenicity-related protein
VPDIISEVHRQWQSYNGFTFTFTDYIEVNMTEKMDEPKTKQMMEIIDPLYYFNDRLAEIPKYVVVTSDDEFMSMDWTQIYWD